MSGAAAPSMRGHWLRAAGLAALYAGVSLLGRALIIPAVFIAPVRLSIGVAATALILNPPSTWWLYLLALAPVHLWQFWQSSSPHALTIALQYFAATAAGALVAAALMRWWSGPRPRLDNLKTCVVFLLAVVLVGPIIGASIGTTSIISRELTVSAATTWETWLFAESVGCLVAGPVLFALASLRSRERGAVTLKAAGEAAAIGVCIFIATFYTLDPVAIGISGMTLPMLYLPFPFLLWAGIRFGPEGAAAANFELTLITIVTAMRALGPFGGPWSVDSLVGIQQFLVVTGATTVTLAGLAAERRRTIRALTRSQQNLQLAFRVSGDLVMLTRASDGRILEINDALAELQTTSLDHIVGRQIDDVAAVIDAGDRARVLDALKAGRCHNIEVRFRTVGPARFLLLSAEILEIDDTKCVLWVGHDITDRKLAETALQESETRYRELFDAAQDIVFVLGPEGDIREVNRAFEQTTGWTREEWIGRSAFDLVTSDQREDVRRAHAARLAGGPRQDRRWSLRHRDGTDRLVEIRADVHMRDNQVLSLLAIARDVTAQVRAEEERAQVEAQMQQTRKMEAIGQLAGGIAHDFNNLLQAIHGYAQIAAAHLPDGHAAGRPVDQILAAAERAAALTRQLLTFSRRQPMSADELDLNAVVTDVSNLLRRLIGERITLGVETASGLPRITCDRSQIEQVVMNLCINARDAMKQGGRLTISTGAAVITADECHAKPWAREGSWVFLRVADEGSGIPDEALPHIFEPFFTTKGVGEGTGLGLSTVYAVISRQGGLIDVDTRVGGGTRITVYLPASAAPAQREEPPAPRLRGHETILLAEDDELLRQLAVETLTEAGYHVIAAHDGAQAEALAREQPAAMDVAVLDVVMPKRSGRKVSETLRGIRPDLPIVFMSGYTFGALDDMALAGTTVLQKPFTREALLRQVREAIDSTDKAPSPKP
jgi:PAS domain S-box-containing protein